MLAVAATAAVLAPAAIAARERPPAPPHVVGPRQTTAERPVYRFRSARAVRFRCAFDSTLLHTCRPRYSEPLELGRHVLRVRAVGRRGTQSRVVAVRIQVVDPLPRLHVSDAVTVGAGAGVPAVLDGAVWVPTTADGGLARVAGGTVVARAHVGQTTADAGFLDAAVAGGGAVWSASDAGGTVARVDPASGAVTSSFAVGDRPGGLAEGAGAIWAFHFLQGTITRIGEDDAAVGRIDVAGARATGIAFGAGSVWLLSADPDELVRVDARTSSTVGSIALKPPFARRHAFIETWWLAYGDGALWATLPNYDAVARVDAITGGVQYARVRYGAPFGVAVGGGAAWVAAAGGVVRFDSATAAPLGAVSLPAASTSGFVSIAFGDGAAWATNSDRGTLVSITP